MTTFLRFCGHGLLFAGGFLSAAFALRAVGPADTCLLSIRFFERKISRPCCRGCTHITSTALPPAAIETNGNEGQVQPAVNVSRPESQPINHRLRETGTDMQLDDLSQLEEFIYGPNHDSTNQTINNTSADAPSTSYTSHVQNSTAEGAGENTRTDGNGIQNKEEEIKVAITEAMDISLIELDRMIAAIAAGRVTSIYRRRPRLEQRSFLEKAIRACTPGCITYLLNRGFDVYAVEGDMELALLLGLEHNDVELIDLALGLGADIECKVQNYGTLLQKAVAHQSVRQVEILLERGAIIHKIGTKTDFGGNCSLMAAISGQNSRLVDLLLERGADPSEAQGIFGSAIHTAAFLGRYETLETLLEVIPESDSLRSEDPRYTPLEMALQGFWNLTALETNPHIQTMKLLLSKGSKFEKRGMKLWIDLLYKVIRK